MPEIMILRRGWGLHARERLAVIPRQPVSWYLFHVGRVPLQFGQAPEGVHAIEFARMNRLMNRSPTIARWGVL